MTELMVRHKVKDYAGWKTAFDNFASVRKSGGEKSFRILHPTEDPNDLILLFEWDSVEKAKTFFASQELKTTMEKAGVAEKPTIQFVDEVAKGAL